MEDSIFNISDEPERTGKCFDCGKDTDYYFCDACNEQGLEQMDRENDAMRAEFQVEFVGQEYE